MEEKYVLRINAESEGVNREFTYYNIHFLREDKELSNIEFIENSEGLGCLVANILKENTKNDRGLVRLETDGVFYKRSKNLVEEEVSLYNSLVQDGFPE